MISRANPGKHQPLKDWEKKRSQKKIPRRRNQRGSQTGNLGFVISMIAVYYIYSIELIPYVKSQKTLSKK